MRELGDELDDVEAVRALLEMGADPDMTAPDDDGWEWISAGGKTPTPLHCVAIAWTHVPEHVEIIRLLVERGAVIADTVLQDYWIETPRDVRIDGAIDLDRAGADRARSYLLPRDRSAHRRRSRDDEDVPDPVAHHDGVERDAVLRVTA